MKSPPRTVLIFSTLGLVPLIYGTIGSVFEYNILFTLNISLPEISLLYAALILSFLGGCLFAFEIKKSEKISWKSLLFTFLPTLWAFSSLLLTNFKASALAIGFLVTYEFDRKAVKNNLAPAWWLSLRLPLTTVVIVLLVIIGFYA